MSRAEDIIKAYEAWDPDQESATDLASRLGISKARLYQVLEKEGVSPKARRPRDSSISTGEVDFIRGPLEDRDSVFLGVEVERSLVQELAERGVQALLDELETLRTEVAKYRKRYGPLE